MPEAGLSTQFFRFQVNKDPLAKWQGVWLQPISTDLAGTETLVSKTRSCCHAAPKDFPVRGIQTKVATCPTGLPVPVVLWVLCLLNKSVLRLLSR